MSPQAEAFVSLEIYLETERKAETKSEYCKGRVFAMAGASYAHNLLAAQIITCLGSQLRGRDCRVLPSDMRIKVRDTGLYTYPDVSVLCGKPQFEEESTDILLNPVTIIEVLSPSTEAYDRGDKFAHYRELASLEEYLLVSQKAPKIEYYRREGAFWVFSEAKNDQTLTLEHINCNLPLVEIYADIPFKN